MPYTQTLPLVLLHKESLISKLLSRLHIKARLSLEPILRYASLFPWITSFCLIRNCSVLHDEVVTINHITLFWKTWTWYVLMWLEQVFCIHGSNNNFGAFLTFLSGLVIIFSFMYTLIDWFGILFEWLNSVVKIYRNLLVFESSCISMLF